MCIHNLAFWAKNYETLGFLSLDVNDNIVMSLFSSSANKERNLLEENDTQSFISFMVPNNKAGRWRNLVFEMERIF